MFGFRLSVKFVAGVLLAGLTVSGASVAEAQSAHRTRRESNANRKARIQKTIDETYGHRYEVAGGGGYMRFRSGEDIKKNNEVTFWMTGTRYFTARPKLGIIAEVRGGYGNAKIGNNPYINFNPQISEYPFMGGVTYRVYAKEKFAVNVIGEGGVALGKFDSGSKAVPSQFLGVWETAWRPVFSVGANFDYNLYPNLAFRVTPTYLGTLFRMSPLSLTAPSAGSIQNNIGLNIGFVYRFGKIK